jgi:protein-disulfide isomerase
MGAPVIIQGPNGVAGAMHDPKPSIRVDSFIDYQCPYCRRFEHLHGPTLQKLVDDGAIEWVLHPVAFLDELSLGNHYSTRGGAFAFGIAANAPAQFGAYSNWAFWHQPKENTPGLTDEQLVEYALAVDVPEASARAALDPHFLDYMKQTTEYAEELGVDGIPTVLITPAGKKSFLWNGEQPFDQIVAEIAEHLV